MSHKFLYVQAFLLEQLLFTPELEVSLEKRSKTLDDFASLTEDEKSRALVHGMVAILFLCGGQQRAVIAENSQGLRLTSASDFQSHLKFITYTERGSACHAIENLLPLFRSGMGILAFVVSALLSRGLDSVQADIDDPQQGRPLANETGYTSQDIVNLLISGQAIPNVSEEQNLGGDYVVKGIKTPVEVGYVWSSKFFCSSPKPKLSIILSHHC